MDPITVLLSRKLFCHKQRTDTGWSRRLRQVKCNFHMASSVRNVTTTFEVTHLQNEGANLAADLNIL